MKLTKFNSMQTPDPIGKWIDTLFNTSLSDVIGTDHTITSPSVNISENDSQFLLQLAAPGLTKQDFNISVDSDQLVISAEKKSEQEETEGRFTRREFSYGSFRRSFHLDDTINRDGISAAYEDGVLTLTLPKKEEATKLQNVKTIEIN